MRMVAAVIRAGLYMGFLHDRAVCVASLGCLRREYFRQDDDHAGDRAGRAT